MSLNTSASGCAVRPAIARMPRIVSVNGVVITRAAIAQELQNHPAAKPTEAWLAAAHALAVRELLLQEARRLSIVPMPLADDEGRREADDEALVRMLIANEVKTPEADDAVCRQYYYGNQHRFRSSDLYEVRHILLSAPPTDTVRRSAARQQAESVLATVKSAPSLIGELAARLSMCPSREAGGNLGQIGGGQTVPEFEAALAKMKSCEIGLIETRYGIHIVSLDRRIGGVMLPFEMVRERIAAWLNEKVRRQAIRQYIGILAGRAEIIGIDLSCSATPLVQ